MRNRYQGTCPGCGEEIELVHHRLEIPHFSDILLVSIGCARCGYRHIDTIILGEGDPVMWAVPVDAPEDLAIRVVRSTTGTIEIPELGLKVEPGTACEGFVTNIEGVLNRFEQAVANILMNPETEEERTQAEGVLSRILDAKNGSIPFTLILTDPAGNSALISDKAQKTLLDSSET
ncbi:ZPR1 zinc finger domain-containing protein [Methanoculleus sp. FWC-SCC1]|uniref:ZPR1 zinc finger domain-containing protein n=1 Tax=Methanoculleus frigidifontis TaxID=2584085 RepID=A0ABT8M9Z1_9EURY|nr:ZPR1 zinc finger domain-containing protein [Methanoculleus sp. FWC-SCC1]MDN7024739.1 ZPR1 zinc finger domain-containing protein [Methanoculleus sp. FWC-SCC1]